MFEGGEGRGEHGRRHGTEQREHRTARRAPRLPRGAPVCRIAESVAGPRTAGYGPGSVHDPRPDPEVRLIRPSLAVPFVLLALLLRPAPVRAGSGPEPLGTRLTPCVLLAAPGVEAAPAPRPDVAPALAPRSLGRVVVLEAAAGAISSLGFLEHGGRIKAGLFATSSLLVARDLFEARPVTFTRGHAVAIAGLAALAVADVALERDGAPRERIVLVDFAALNAIALAARLGARD